MMYYFTLLYCLYISTLFIISLGTYAQGNDLKTKWMTHLGCFRMKGLSIDSHKNYTLPDNQPKRCSRICENWNYFALQKFDCICMNYKPTEEIVDNICHNKCPVFHDQMYCGSSGNEVTVYRHESDSDKQNDEDCLTVTRYDNNDSVKQTSCNGRFSFMCKKRNGLQKFQESNFFKAKLTCENLRGKLINLFDIKQSHNRNNISYWLGTFRQTIHIDNAKEPVTTSLIQSTKLEATTNKYKATTRLNKSASVTSDKEETTTQYETEAITFPRMSYDYQTKRTTGHLENTETLAEPLSEKENENAFKCGIYCFTLGIILCFVIILALTACLFQLRQQWQIIYHRSDRTNIKNSKISTSDEENDEQKESKPVYLDPAEQVAVFHKRNLSKINHKVYDTSEVYSTTTHTLSRQPFLSEYQKLNFSKTESSKTIPFTEKTDEKYTEPWGAIKGSKRYTKKKSLRNFMSKIKSKRQDAYEETVIDVKGILYDQPAIDGKNKRSSEPWKNYRYNSNKLPIGGVLAAGRGLSVANKDCMNTGGKERQNTAKPISLPASEFHDRIYAVPETTVNECKSENDAEKSKVKLRTKMKEKRKMVKSKLLRFSQSFNRVRRPETVNIEDGYEVPNTKKRSGTFPKSVWYDTDEKLSKSENNAPKKRFNYEFAAPLSIYSDAISCPVSSDKQQGSIRIMESNTDQISKEKHYDMAIPILKEQKAISKMEKKNTEIPIYFEPVG